MHLTVVQPTYFLVIFPGYTCETSKPEVYQRVKAKLQAALAIDPTMPYIDQKFESKAEQQEAIDEWLVKELELENATK